MKLSTVLRGWRHHEELSLREAAERIGIDRGALYRVEQGEGMNGVTLAAIWRWMTEKDSLSKEEAA